MCHCNSGYPYRHLACIWDVFRYGAVIIRLQMHHVKWAEAQFSCQADGGGNLANLFSLPSKFIKGIAKNIANILFKIKGPDFNTFWFGNSPCWYFVVIANTANKRHYHFENACLRPEEFVNLRDSPSRYILCEHRLAESTCDSDADCDLNATCIYNQLDNFQVLVHSNVTRSKTCGCNNGFFGNGSSCEEIDL